MESEKYKKEEESNADEDYRWSVCSAVTRNRSGPGPRISTVAVPTGRQPGARKRIGRRVVPVVGNRRHSVFDGRESSHRFGLEQSGRERFAIPIRCQPVIGKQHFRAVVTFS